MAVEDVYELAYREAVRTLEHQRAAASELRSGAGMLLATASIAVSLLGQEAFRGTRPLAWAAVVCFGLLSLCVLVVVWPHADWRFGVDPQALLVAHLKREQPTVVDLSLDLIGHVAHYRSMNARHLSRRVRAFRVGACLLATQMVLTIAAAIGIV